MKSQSIAGWRRSEWTHCKRRSVGTLLATHSGPVDVAVRAAHSVAIAARPVTNGPERRREEGFEKRPLGDLFTSSGGNEVADPGWSVGTSVYNDT